LAARLPGAVPQRGSMSSMSSSKVDLLPVSVV
jgi:hypothetical protein